MVSKCLVKKSDWEKLFPTNCSCRNDLADVHAEARSDNKQ